MHKMAMTQVQHVMLNMQHEIGTCNAKANTDGAQCQRSRRTYDCKGEREGKNGFSNVVTSFQHNRPIRLGYIVLVLSRPSLTFWNQPIDQLPWEIDYKKRGRTKRR